jgi:predicted amidohydrolase
VKIAIAQMPMAWTVHENTRTIVEHLDTARSRGAEVALFPECATTGFHRRVPEHASPAAVREAMIAIQQRCAALRMAAIIGTPFFPSADHHPIWNAAVAIDSRGQLNGEILHECPIDRAGITLVELELGPQSPGASAHLPAHV